MNNHYGLKVTSKMEGFCGLTQYFIGEGRYALELLSSEDFEVGQIINIIDGRAVASKSNVVGDTGGTSEAEKAIINTIKNGSYGYIGGKNIADNATDDEILELVGLQNEKAKISNQIFDIKKRIAQRII